MHIVNTIKRILMMAGCIALIFGALYTRHPVRAQNEPTAIIDAAFADLSHRLGRTLTRGNVDSWTWEQIDFPDSSLGCPQPGQAYAQVVTRGYKIVIMTAGVAYDYRVTNNGQGLILCSPAGGQPPPTAPPTAAPNPVQPTPIPPVTGGTAQPVDFSFPVAYIGQDGNVRMTQVGQTTNVAITGDADGSINKVPLKAKMTHLYTNIVWSPQGNAFAFVDGEGGNVL